MTMLKTFLFFLIGLQESYDEFVIIIVIVIHAIWRVSRDLIFNFEHFSDKITSLVLFFLFFNYLRAFIIREFYLSWLLIEILKLILNCCKDNLIRFISKYFIEKKNISINPTHLFKKIRILFR